MARGCRRRSHCAKDALAAAAARSEANINGEHHLAGLGFSNSDPSVLTNIFHSDNIAAGFAWSRYRSDELDQLLEDAQGDSREGEALPMQTFGYSVIYLMLLFVFLLADHYLKNFLP